jgi:predicted flap endonuclease-1-like 5' DNA nuclease
MNWLGFFIGVLAGWIVEWFIDLVYWRRKYQSSQKEIEALQARLDEAQKRIRTFQVKGWEVESEPQRIPSAEVATVEAAIVPSDTDLAAGLAAPGIALPAAEVDAGLEAPAGALAEADLEAPRVEAPDSGLDALFDGLRARFPDVDLDSSIARLRAKFPDLDLKTALQGLKVDFPDLDIDGAFEALKARFLHLAADAAVGGVATEPGDRHAELASLTPEKVDDLKLLEGIGPKISQLLRDNGILTFAQLANTSSDRLQAILQAGGPNFQLADPTTWPDQAKLAADEAWDELQALQDRLIGGRESRRRDR